MTKQDVVSEIVKATGQHSQQVSAVVNAFTEVVKDSVADGQTINIRGFGHFGPKKRAQKIARNLKTLAPLIVAEHTIPVFVPSDEFKNKVRNQSPASLPQP